MIDTDMDEARGRHLVEATLSKDDLDCDNISCPFFRVGDTQEKFHKPVHAAIFIYMDGVHHRKGARRNEPWQWRGFGQGWS